MPINQFNDHPWQRRDAGIGADRYERELDRRADELLDEDDGYREWCETIEKQLEEQDENAR